MSACVPLPLRSRRSIAGLKRSTDSRVWTGAEAPAFRSKTEVDDIVLRVGVAFTPVSSTFSISSSLAIVSDSTVCACTGGVFQDCYNVVGGVDHVIRVVVDRRTADIETVWTPMVTWRRRLAKAAYPLRHQRLKRGVRFVWISFIL